MKKILSLLALIILLMAAVWYGFQKMTASENHVTTTSNPVELAGKRIKVQNVNNLKPGDVTLAFTLYGTKTNELQPKDLKMEHEKLIHLILVRDDVTLFQHLHPEYLEGQWMVKTILPDQGLYHMYVSIVPVSETAITLRVPLLIGGSTRNPQFPDVTTTLSTSVDGIGVTLQSSSPFQTGEDTTLTFALTKNSIPVTQISPYLGAFGHVVIIRHGNVDDYVHAHPITESQPTDGKVIFESIFADKGTYTAFAQFNLNGEVKTFPITFSVDSAGGTSAEKKPNAPRTHQTPSH